MPDKIKVNLNNIVFLERAQEFLDWYHFPVELVLDVVRNPQRLERDQSSAQLGYTVARMVRGDIVVCVGLKDPDRPAVIYIHLTFPEENERQTRAGGPGGGDGKGKGPTSVRGLRSWLISGGCKLETGGSGHHKVYYNGQMIGSVPSTPSDNARSIKNAYSHLRKALAAAKHREHVGSTVNEWAEKQRQRGHHPASATDTPKLSN